MFDSPIDEIKSRLNIVEVVSDYVQLKKAGANYKAVCPFHSEKTPSFMVSEPKQIWRCFGCGLGGDVLEFVKLMENVEFGEALKILADRAGVKLTPLSPEGLKQKEQKNVLYEINDAAAKIFERNLWGAQGHEALDYLKKRSLTDQTIKNWQLGWAADDFHALENELAGKFKKDDIVLAGLIVKKDRPHSYFDRFRGRIMFPILNIHGQTVAFTGRLLREQADAGKYVNSPETPLYNKSRELYGLFQAKMQIRKQNAVILVEGNMDVIAAHQAGSVNVVASSGTALTLDQLTILRRFCENLLLALDEDSAGTAATRKALELALGLGFNVKILNLNGAKDPDELIRRGIGLWQKAIASAGNFVEYFFERTLKTHDAQSVEGKREIVKQLAPLVFRLSEPVSRAHFIRKLSVAVNVAESAISDIISKLSLPKVARPEIVKGVKKSNREILEELILSFSLYLKSDAALKELKEENFTSKNRELYRILSSGENELEKLKSSYPNLASQFELLAFIAQSEVTEKRLDPKEELKTSVQAFKRLILKERMAELAQLLKAAENRKDQTEINKLSAEFTELSRTIKETNL